MAITNVSKSAGITAAAVPSSGNTAALTMVTTLFFMWGFVTCLNDILIPHLKSIFELNYAEVMLVQFVFFTGYFVFAMPAGKVVQWLGYKWTMVTGLLVMALGALLFIPAASLPSFPFFLAALVIVAAGMTALQVSANAYVAILGSPQTASSRLNLAQAFNSLGTFVAPYFGSFLILSTAALSAAEVAKLSAPALHDYRVQQAATVKLPYFIIGAVLVALALAIAFFKLPRISAVEDTTAIEDPNTRTAISLWKYRHLILGVLGIFVYVGAEVSIGSFLVNYFTQPDTGAMTAKTAAFYVSFYWGCAMVGRFIGSFVLQKLPTGGVVGAVAIAACALVTTSMLSYGHVAVWTIILVGLFNSVMFPSIFTLGIAGLGPLTGKGSGLLVAAIVGGAVIPELEGLLADAIGVHHAFLLPALCYIYIAFYGFKGSRPPAIPEAAIPAVNAA
jgi:FHS family L-fucose permease-like MFS transporter